MKDIKEIFTSNLNELMNKHNETLTDLSDSIDVAFSTVSDWKHGKKMPRTGSIQKIAIHYQVNLNDLLGEHSTLPSNAISVSHTVSIPIIGTITCGEPITAKQNIDGYREEPIDYVPSGTNFYLKYKGNSMYPTLQDGSYVLIHEQPTVEDMQIAAVLVDDDASIVLKRVHYQGKMVILSVDNPDFPPIVLNKENPGRILGKAVKASFDL